MRLYKIEDIWFLEFKLLVVKILRYYFITVILKIIKQVIIYGILRNSTSENMLVNIHSFVKKIHYLFAQSRMKAKHQIVKASDS